MTLVKTYFFVPANNPKFIANSDALTGIDAKVFDLEDAITPESFEESLRNVVQRQPDPSDWVRVVVDHDFESTIDVLSRAGYRNLILPKLRDDAHLESTLDVLDRRWPDCGIIVLIENPLLYVQLSAVLKNHATRILGIGLGSHDFAASTRMKHDLETLHPVRLNIALMAHAYGIEAIDVASMQIKNLTAFEEELASGFEMGYRAKFILHPRQLHAVAGFDFYSQEDVDHAGIVLSKMDLQKAEQKAVTMVDGVIYEKPHLDRLKEIYQWGLTHYGTDR